VNLSGDPAQEYLSNGITDALTTDLAEIGSLKVISHTSAMQYKNTKKSLPEIARELNVDGIIEGTVERFAQHRAPISVTCKEALSQGTVQRFGDRVRVTAQLMHGPSDRQLWSKSYEQDLRDDFSLERDVTGDIAFQVQARLTTPEHDRPAQPHQVEPRVLEAYLQGNDHLGRSWVGSKGEGFGWDEELDKAAEDFQKAIDADPNFAPAYNGLASAYQERLNGSSEGAAIARGAAEKAAELDPNYSDAQATLGKIKCNPIWTGVERKQTSGARLQSTPTTPTPIPNSASSWSPWATEMKVYESATSPSSSSQTRTAHRGACFGLTITMVPSRYSG